VVRRACSAAPIRGGERTTGQPADPTGIDGLLGRHVLRVMLYRTTVATKSGTPAATRPDIALAIHGSGERLLADGPAGRRRWAASTTVGGGWVGYTRPRHRTRPGALRSEAVGGSRRNLRRKPLPRPDPRSRRWSSDVTPRDFPRRRGASPMKPAPTSPIRKHRGPGKLRGGSSGSSQRDTSRSRWWRGGRRAPALYPPRARIVASVPMRNPQPAVGSSNRALRSFIMTS